MQKIGIIGAGASGLVCSIYAKSKDNLVVVFDKNSFSGKKLLMTGNGRCNYWNSDQDIKHYHSSSVKLNNIINNDLKDEVLELFKRLGVVPKIKDGYYYPYSLQASSVRDLLYNYAKNLGVEFSFDSLVLDIYKENNKFVVVTKEGMEYFDKIVVATGSKAYPKTGSSGDGYKFAEKFGHTIIPVYPSLVQVKTKGKFLKEWSGIRVDSAISLYEDGVFRKKEVGQLQLTDYGVSGICIFNLSRDIARSTCNIELLINFLPFLENKDINSFFEEREKLLGDVSILEFLEGMLSYKLISVIGKVLSFDINRKWNSLKDYEKDRLISHLVSFKVEVIGTLDFTTAQVCQGGVSLDEVSSSLESLKVEDLFFAGEVLDVDGDCGGYNLGFSFMSGIIVGKEVRK